MNNVATNEGKEKSTIFETVLSSPGMNEKCKINLLLSCQNIILLSRLIETGLKISKTDFDDEIIAAFSAESFDELRTMNEDILKKSNLTEFYEKLKLL
ncbi:MAG: hypothetical protein ACRDE8_05155 [Ginsengibacter sp.]